MVLNMANVRGEIANSERTMLNYSKISKTPAAPVYIVSILMILAGLLLGIYPIASELLHKNNSTELIRVDGTVEKVYSKSAHNNAGVACTYEYSFTPIDSNEVVKSKLDQTDNSQYSQANCLTARGAKVTIAYDPNDVERNMPDPDGQTNSESLMGAIMIIPSGVLLIALGAMIIKLFSDARKQVKPDISSLVENNIVNQTKHDPRFK